MAKYLRRAPRKIKNKPREERIREISELARTNNSSDYIGKKIGIGSSTVYQYGLKNGIKLTFPEYVRIRKRKNIDKLIDQGMTLKEMGNQIGISKQRVHQYIKGTKQVEYWKSIRKGMKRKILYSRIYAIIKKRFVDVATKESWAHQKAAEYISLTRYNPERYEMNTLLNIFQAYEDAKNKGGRLSLEELAAEPNLYPSAVKRILEKVGLKSMYEVGRRKI